VAAGPVEVRLWRNGDIAVRETCEDMDDAVAFVQRWADTASTASDPLITAVDIDDLTTHHQVGQVLEPELEVEAGELDADEQWPRQ
jgi:hypothetical protein